MIEVKNLSKRFGSTRVLNHLNFEVNRGEILGFLGPNGAGKTTTIRILTGYLTPTEGEVSVAGIAVGDHPVEARKHIGYLPESVPVYREMTVTEYLRFVSELKGVRSDRRSRHLEEIIEQCGLGTVRNKLSGHLSKGYRQRLGLAQALVGDPDVLILDEPTSGLDPRQIIDIRELIRSLGGDRTIFLSSHILPEVSQLCHRVIILNNGEVIAVDTPENLDKNLSGSNIINLMVSGPDSPETLLNLIHPIPGLIKAKQLPQQEKGAFSFEIHTETDSDCRPVIARAIVESRWDLLELKHASQSLEDIFISLVTREEVTQ